MAAKLLNIDFYRVKVEDKSNRTFVDLLEEMNKMPDDACRAQHRTDDAVRLQVLKKGHTYWRGDMLRIRMNESPVKAKLSGETKEIDLDEDEGLGEETAFMYHIPTGILVLQRNRIGVSASAMAKYFRILCKAKAVTLECILKEDALKRISQMETIRTFEIHFAGVDSGQSLKGKGHAAKTMYSMLSEFQAPNASIKLSVGRKKGTLQNVVSAITDLFGDQSTPSDVKRVVVIGKDDDDADKTFIDLLQDRLTELVVLDDADGGRISSVQRFKAITTAWDRHKDYLEAQYATE